VISTNANNCIESLNTHMGQHRPGGLLTTGGVVNDTCAELEHSWFGRLPNYGNLLKMQGNLTTRATLKF